MLVHSSKVKNADAAEHDRRTHLELGFIYELYGKAACCNPPIVTL